MVDGTYSLSLGCTVKPILKDCPIGHKNMVSRQVISVNRLGCIKIWDSLPVIYGLLRQVVCYGTHGSGL